MLLLVFNVAVVAFLVYRMLQVIKSPLTGGKKILILIVGVFLLLAPLGIFIGAFVPAVQYLLVYPLAISLFLYLIKEVA
jgi:hypothetical protein